MKNAEQPAFPNSEALDPLMEHRMGLTKREYFAGLAMQGLMTHVAEDDYLKEKICSIAIELADELLTQLSTTPTGTKQ